MAEPFQKGVFDKLLEPIFLEIEDTRLDIRNLPLFPMTMAWRILHCLQRARQEKVSGLKAVQHQYLAEHARFILDREYPREISIGEIAARLQVARSTLFRQFQKKYAISPMQYLTNLRLEQAKKILLQTRLSVKEIAAAVGFRGAHFFCRIFNGYVGRAPGAWRRAQNPKR